MNETKHISVLLEEAVSMLALKPGDVALDATLGGGGHTRSLLRAVGESGTVLALDADKSAVERFSQTAKLDAELSLAISERRLRLVVSNFSNIEDVATNEGLFPVQGILADLGFSSDQIEDAERGLSLKLSGPLDMRLDRDTSTTAADIVNTSDEKELVRIFREYGDEAQAGRIAKMIVSRRVEKPFTETLDLAERISESLPAEERRKRKVHPATKVFQSLRIAVNEEYSVLESFLEQAVEVLAPGGRLSVITFHSGEDRIVKQFFQKMAKGCVCPPFFPLCVCGREARVRIVTAQPIVPREEEVENNPRSRSAKLRVVEKC